MTTETRPVPTSAVVRSTDQKQQFEQIRDAIKSREDTIVATLVPTIDRERFFAVALQAITRSPRLLECTPASIVKALRDAAELGLEPSGLMGSAYLVPYKNRRSQRYEAQLIPGYRGLIDLARRSGEVRTVEAHVVRERDEFAFEYGSEQSLHHRPWINYLGERAEATQNDRGETVPGKLLDAGPYVAAYSFARLTSGEFQFEVMDLPQIEAVRRRSKAADDGPWATDWAEMARKTPTRRLLKYLPLSVNLLQRALELEDEAEGDAVAVSVSAPARRALADALHVPQDAHHDEHDAESADSDTDAETSATNEQETSNDESLSGQHD